MTDWFGIVFSLIEIWMTGVVLSVIIVWALRDKMWSLLALIPPLLAVMGLWVKMFICAL